MKLDDYGVTFKVRSEGTRCLGKLLNRCLQIRDETDWAYWGGNRCAGSIYAHGSFAGNVIIDDKRIMFTGKNSGYKCASMAFERLKRLFECAL